MEHLVESLKKLAASRPDDVQKFKVIPNTAHILLTLPDETKFGFLRDNMTKPLESLLRKGPAIQVEAVGITERLCKEIGRATKPEDALVHVDINIYGPQSLRDEVGAVLSGHKLWLQRPDCYRSQYPYSNQSNPHMIIFPDVHGDLVEEEIQKEISPASKPRTAKTKLDKFMEEVHISAEDKENGLENETGDQRLKTPLLMHQQQALSFMLQRESGDIPEQRRLWEKTTKNGQEMFIHRITKTSSPVKVEEMGGGVLSDEMGMGKSLCILALIVQTLDASHAWADQRKNDEHTSSKIRRHSHSSLIIVPSALLINHWLKEIRDHTGDALKTLKYHGPGRERELGALEQSDVVITTYNTLAAEATAKKSQLHKINWYRVVLDEGHIIRRQATTLYRHCADLEARSRWCLTGTPIQNRLEDIGALFAFLRAEPFHSIAQFRRFICAPYEEGKPIAKERLILLYRSLCLRRTKDILTLPGCDEQTRTLELTDDEKRQYAKTTNILDRYMRTQEHRAGGAGYGHYHSLQSWKKTQFGLFQAHLQLRILCNHGTFQKPFSWKKRDMKDEKTAEREAFISELGAGSELLCDGCKAFRPIIGLAAGAQHNFAGDCPHSFCLECLEDFSGLPGLENMRTCPLCLRNGNTVVRADDATDVVMQDADRTESTDRDMHQDAYFNHVGYSTKMEALVEDVKKDIVESKSIIFSCWTRTLDLIAKTLRKEQIEFDRIDGKCLLSERQRIIDRFAAKDSAPVLLMTTGTGAFGLNLTAANRIFIVEPQWNPSVENQAIARAIRLRQEKKVQVTRYFIKDTIEEQMMSQQVKKRQVASFGVVREDGLGAAQEHQEEDAHS
ncbi:SNF2 family N-terminal domain-containing protein [Rhypophila decipiens]|uniref:SNF2 family N-terminal domain-containing protein n=1 Tax=Rhypophila decipiens TaxID=261697 RepID=A0AAN7B7B1_9PEZI|nr:SNF2 family N-terminal domain-containing protein [Rhypophila decipiens]